MGGARGREDTVRALATCEHDGTSAPCRKKKSSGRWMAVRTDQPGVQLYTGNYLDGSPGRGGVSYGKHHGFCLETQRFPDTPNRPHFPSCVLRPGQVYTHTTVHEFGTASKPPTGAY